MPPKLSVLRRERLAALRWAALLLSSLCAVGCSPPMPAMAPMADSRPPMAPGPMAAPAAPSPPPPPPGATAGAPAAIYEESSVGDTAAGSPPAAPSAAAQPSTGPAPTSPRPGAPARVAQKAPTPATGQKAPPPPPKGAPQPPAKGPTAAPGKGEPGAPAVPVAPMLIYTGDLQMQVADEAAIPAAIDSVIDLAESVGGYLAGRKDTSVEVRVPSVRFRESLTRLEKLGEIVHRSVTASDVSEEYNDLEVKLGNLKATRQRLQEFLARAGNMADMLQVEKELERVAREIDQMEGRMRFLRSRAAFSTVTVALSAKPKAAVVAKAEKPATPPPRELDLPIEWLGRVGLDTLLNLGHR